MKSTPFIFLCLSAALLLLPSSCFESAKTFVLAAAKPLSPSSSSKDKDKNNKAVEKDKPALLEKEVADLKAEITQLVNENKSLTRKLRSVSDFIESPSAAQMKERYNLIVADVMINYDASIWRRSFTINRGSSDGIETGLPVISGRYLIGKITGVASSTSKVQLITDPAFRCKALVVPPPRPKQQAKEDDDNKDAKKPEEKDNLSNGIGVLCGISFNQYSVKWISRDVRITAGWDILTARDMENTIPQSLIIGKVASISEDGNFNTLYGNPAIDFYSLENVIILKHRAK
ncbi:MAG: rod shape-determining protein MreC [Planctomycetota bacterium]